MLALLAKLSGLGGGGGGGGGPATITTKEEIVSVAYSTCPSGKATYKITYTDGRMTNRVFVACVGGSNTTTKPTVDPKVDTSKTDITINQNINTTKVDPYDVSMMTINAIKYGNAITTGPSAASIIAARKKQYGEL